MKSTRQLLATPYQPGSGSNAERLKHLEVVAGHTIDVPEIYLDEIHKLLMTQPCNIRLTDQATDYYIDISTKQKLNNHPLSNLPFDTRKSYPIDKALAARIEAMLMIEEIKQYLDTTETARLQTLLTMLHEKNDQDVLALLAFQTEDVLAAYGYPIASMPRHFFSHHPLTRLMTLPVRLDGQYTVDFHELLACQPTATLTGTALANKQAEVAEIKRRRRQELLQEMTKLNIHPDQLHDEHACLEDFKPKKSSLELLYAKKLAAIDNLTVHHFIDNEKAEYINPCTGQPIQSIEIQYALLREIDEYIDPCNYDLRTTEAMYLKLRSGPDEKAYTVVLQENHFPPDKIPESLLLGRIPENQQSLEIMTHPVLLDGEYLIDYLRLKAYWATSAGILSYLTFFWKRDLHGTNPFTGKKLRSIVYDETLKAATEHFILNLDYFKLTIKPRDVHNGSFLRKPGKFLSFGHRLNRYGLSTKLPEATPEKMGRVLPNKV